MRLTHRVLFVALVFVVLLLGATRAASAQAVIVVSVEDPSRETRRLVAPYLDEMTHRPSAVVSPEDYRGRLGTMIPSSGRSDPGLQIADLMAEYDKGHESFKARQWQEAANRLGAAEAKAHQNEALLVDHGSYRDTWIKGEIALGMSRYRLKDLAGADEVHEELARTFPNQDIAIRAMSGKESAEYYAAAQNRLVRKGLGVLVVEVNDQAALVYLDTGNKPQNAALEAEVLPGLHRVLVRTPGTDGQLYKVIVEPNKVTHLTVDLKFGDAVVIADRYLGLIFGSTEDRAKYAVDYACRLAVAANAGLEMVLVERTTLRGQPAVTSVVRFADSGAWVRGRIVVLDGQNDDERMRALARETFHVRIEDKRISELPDPAMPESAPSAPRTWPKWAAGGGAVIALATGGTLLYLHEACGAEDDLCRRTHPSALPGYVGLSTGVALGALATYLFFSDARSASARGIAVLPTRQGAILTLSATF